jgi:hypothetical protein
MKLTYAMGCLALCMIGTPIAAAPLVAPATADATPSHVHTARGDCRWVDNKWTYQRGDKRLVCRPDRPSGNGWGWRSEGTRNGWYNVGRREWHFNGW